MANTTVKKKDPAVHQVSLRFREIQNFFIKPYREADPENFRVPGATYYQLVKLSCGLIHHEYPHVRTFVRKDAQPINGKYLYIFRSSTPHPTAEELELFKELKFSKGYFQHVLLDGDKGQRGLDVRVVQRSEPRNEVLFVPIAQFNTPRFYYFFLLVPFQYPWKVLEQVKATLPDRASRLPDRFWCDALTTPDKASAPIATSITDDKEDPRGFQVYLLDHIAEGTRRAEQFAQSINTWQCETDSLAKDELYPLAKRIDALIGSQNELEEELRIADFRSFINSKEQPLNEAATAAQASCLALLHWIGMEAQWLPNNRLLWFDQPSHTTFTPPELASSDAHFNEFSRLVRDFAETSRYLPAIVEETVDRVHRHLGLHGTGRRWLESVSNAYVRRSPPLPLVADGGAIMLFQQPLLSMGAKHPAGSPPLDSPSSKVVSQSADDAVSAVRKTVQLVPRTALLLLDSYVPFWDHSYLKSRYGSWGIPIEEVPIDFPRKTRAAIARAITTKARSSLALAGATLLRPVSSEVLERAGGPCYALLLGLEVWNAARFIEKVAQPDHSWSTHDNASLTSALGGTLSAAAKFSKYVDLELGGVGRVSPVISLIGGAFDTIIGGTDTAASLDQSGLSTRTVAQGLKTLGSALAVTGGAASLSVVGATSGALIALLGTGLQALGTWVAHYSSDVNLFLRNSHWGQGPFLTDLSSNGFGYHGNIRELKNDIAAQHHAITCLYFPFVGKLVFDGHSLYVEVSINPSAYRWSTYDSDGWSIETRVSVRTDALPHATREHRFLGFSYINLDSDPITCRREIPEVDFRAQALTVERASITFDPFSNPKMTATRLIDHDTLHPQIPIQLLNTTTAAR